MDYILAVSKIYEQANFNPACFNFTEKKAREKKLWRDERPMPTKKQLKEASVEVEKEEKANEYKEKRKQEYPDIGSQLDIIWKQFNFMILNGGELLPECEDMLSDINKIKSKYPKQG